MIRALLLALTLLLPAAAAAQDTLLILDASNSMWGRVDGRPKIVVARDAVANLARAFPAGQRLGLMAYGHRRAGDCADIELLAPPTADAAAIAARAQAVTPRGRTPIAGSLQAAAGTGIPRLVLLSDGIETCNADPCAVARALKQSRPDLVVHVIGFDIAEARDRAALACIAEATGGRFVPAQSAADLAAALAAVTATAAPPAPAPPPPAQAAGETNLTLEAVEIEGGQPVPVTWTLVALETPPRAILSNDGRMRPALRVPAGRYEATARAGTARVAERFEVAGAQQIQRIVLNIGTLRATGSLGPGAPPTGGNWTIIADEVPGARAGETVTTSGAREPGFRLVQGSYRLRFQSGQAMAETDLFVPAGQTVTAALSLEAGEITLVATRGGAAVGGVLWEVHRGDAPGRQALATSGAARGRFVLPAGDYLVRVRDGQAWHQAPLAVRAGEVREVQVPLP